MNIKTVTVLGANGTMGKNVSAIFASFGDADVYMVCRSKEDAEKAAEQAPGTVRAETIKERLIPATYEELSSILPKSDLVFESAAEDMEVKKRINQMVAPHLNGHTIFCTGTSGLSVNELADVLPQDTSRRYFGMHFYNPPYSMPLCEIIPNRNTDISCQREVEKYLKDKLFRTVVEVKDRAAFLGNRIGFFFINEAFQYAERYKEQGGIDYIDEILGGFTGRNMPPVLTSDFVGLDVHNAIIKNVYENSEDCSKESFSTPDFLKELLSEKRYGRKAGEGAYKTLRNTDGTKEVLVYDIKSGQYREKRKYGLKFRDEVIRYLRNGDYRTAWDIIITDNSIEAGIARDFLVRYVIYSLAVSKEIAPSPHAADHVMAMGFNWVPPMAVIDAFGGKEQLLEIVKTADLNNLSLKLSDIETLIMGIPKSEYDYRKFLKAK
ncbi:3-hydroxyacyl-CoA dehydrogenase family protein [Clostridium sp. AF15-17LB]|nr:3-hydroxyacyl-CoA dehydrogenase family protein [Clostridium sp. AF15-17LB]